MDSKELHWLVGLLEGEGSFRLKQTGFPKNKYYYPVVEVNMIDEDIIRKLVSVSGLGKIYGPFNYDKRFSTKPLWRWFVNKKDEAELLMKKVYPLMGIRRKKQIEDTLARYKEVSK